MTAQVNLLPPEIHERVRARRTTRRTVSAVGAWVVLLAVLYILQLGDLNAARSERDQELAEVAQLREQVAGLQEYAQLDRQASARTALISAAMATEISWARVLNDLALTFPPSSSLVTFSATTPAATAVGGAAPPVVDAESVAAVTFEGYSVERYAPGVVRVLATLGEVDTFSDTYVSQAVNEERAGTEVTRFSGTFDLNQDAYTGRYDQGLPPEVAR